MYRVTTTNAYGNKREYTFADEVAARRKYNRASLVSHNTSVTIEEVAEWKPYVPKIYMLVFSPYSYMTETRTYLTRKGLEAGIQQAKATKRPYNVYVLDSVLDETLSSQD